MSYEKTIVCLANSRKISGRCVAGKEVLAKGNFGAWIRPVSDRQSAEINEEERRYENGGDPRLLDVVRIPFREPRPKLYQSENHLIDDERYWVKVGRLGWHDLANLVDRTRGPLWLNEDSSYNGLNDRLPLARAEKLKGSLLLIEPESLAIKVAVEGMEHRKRRVRARFRYNRHDYLLAVTDPYIERLYLAGKDGEYEISEGYLCVSLGDVYERDQCCYKLIAAVITPERVKKGL